jgi:hypothetical protein
LVKSGQVKDISDLAKLKEHEEEEEGQVKVKGGYAYSHAVELLVDWLINYKTTDGMPSICCMLYAICCMLYAGLGYPHLLYTTYHIETPHRVPALLWPCPALAWPWSGLVWSDAN